MKGRKENTNNSNACRGEGEIASFFATEISGLKLVVTS